MASMGQAAKTGGRGGGSPPLKPSAWKGLRSPYGSAIQRIFKPFGSLTEHPPSERSARVPRFLADHASKRSWKA